jgi:4-amino-4-deoxy-L-arabinose transferase-like glycosyltransferase
MVRGNYLGSRNSRHWLALGALLLIAFALRAFHLGAQDIWWDEARNIFTASRALDAIASAPELDIHPPLYFYLLHLWIGLAGTGEFAVRFFSLWFGVATVPLAFLIGTSLKDHHVGVWAAFLTALAPFFVDEAQQTRMYTLVVFLSALSIYWLLLALSSPQRRFWIGYILAATASFYTHYSFVFVLAAQNLFLLLYLIAEWRKRTPVRALFASLFASQVAIILLYTLQIPNILRQTKIYGNPAMTPPPLSQYTSDLAQVFLLGLKVEPERAAILALMIGAVLVTALIATWRHRRDAGTNHGTALVLIWFVAPLVAYFLVLQKSPQFTPRYIMIATLPLYLLLALLLANLSRRSLAVGTLAAIVLVTADAGAWQSQYFNPAFFNDDTRGLARFITKTATKDDIVFIDVPFPFDYYYRGTAPAHYLFVDIHTTADVLTQMIQNKKRIFFIRWRASDTDPRGYVLYLLDKYATFLGKTSFRGYDVMWYQLPYAPAFSLAPTPQPVSVVFGNRLMLAGFAFGGAVTPETPNVDEPLVATGSKAWVALWWKLTQPVRENYAVSVVLRDERGHLAAQDDRILLNDRHWRTALWTREDTAINVYTPALLPGVAPGDYMLQVIVYDPTTGKRLDVGAGDTFQLGKVHIIPSSLATQSAPEIQHPLRKDFAGLRLLGYDLASSSAALGEPIALTLYWQATRKMTEDFVMHMQLHDNAGKTIAEWSGPPAGDAHPTSTWIANELVRQWIDLVIPRDAPNGDLALVIRVANQANKQIMGETTLTQFWVWGRPHIFTPPSIQYPLRAIFDRKIELLGYALSPDMASGSVHLTLYWKALAPIDTSYTVFTHILDVNNKIWGQKDSIPGDGKILTTSWLVDEIITDEYVIPFIPGVPPGTYQIEIGLYDPASGERLKTADGQDHLIVTSIKSP